MEMMNEFVTKIELGLLRIKDTIEIYQSDASVKFRRGNISSCYNV